MNGLSKKTELIKSLNLCAEVFDVDHFILVFTLGNFRVSLHFISFTAKPITGFVPQKSLKRKLLIILLQNMRRIFSDLSVISTLNFTTKYFDAQFSRVYKETQTSSCKSVKKHGIINILGLSR